MAADAAHVREELRQEMRAAAVRRLQQPGGVTDRVKAWQKSNAAAMRQQGGGIPHAEDVATEPTEVAADISPESVTEEDRVRVKLRQKPKKKKPKAWEAGNKENQDDGDGEETEKERPAAPKPDPASSRPPVVKLAPKKRIVSDDNWMKRRKGRSPPRDSSPKPKADEAPMAIPKDFLQRTAKNPTVQSKIKDWAERVEIPEPQPVHAKQHRPRKSTAAVPVDEDTVSVIASDPGIRAAPKPPVDDGIRVKPMRPRKPKPSTDDDDGIRVTPVRKKEPPDDDGIRVRPMEADSTDDGIRIRPMETSLPDDGIRVRPIPDELPIRPASTRPKPVEKKTRVPSAKQAPLPADVIEVIEDPETEAETPTKRKVSRRRSRRPSPSPKPSPAAHTVEPPEDRHPESKTARHIPPRASSDDESDVTTPTVLGNKSLADIPFGHSAFSVLDLPLGADARNSSTKKPKAQRNPSFKTVPKVFIKKVVTGAKDIIQEMAEPPRPPVAANKPQSIESWLNGTVDPFVESKGSEPATKEPVRNAPVEEKEPVRKSPVGDRESARKSPVEDREPISEPAKTTPESQKRSTLKPVVENRSTPKPVTENRSSPKPAPESRPKEALASTVETHSDSQDSTEPEREERDTTPTKAKSPATPSSGLKRRRATRVAVSPAKSGGRRPFRELLKEAFRGESGGHKLPPTVYPSCETDDDKESDYEEDDWESTDDRHRPAERHPQSDYSSTYYSSAYGSTLSSDLSSQDPPRRRPPTNGVHELSTIVSEESGSTVGSEALSDVSQTTVTQTTAFTKATSLSRRKSQKPGLKRRLTKHSDLVSVLSLPDNGQLLAPRRSKSIKSSRSLHRRPSKANRTRVDELLEEFADDEYFYSRELKALVDGVVPVLVRDVMNGDTAGGAKAEVPTKSVIGMGMALEKLRDFHKRVPVSDLAALLFWLGDVAPLYDKYLDVWRLGFQGLVINLAPRVGRLDDDDSLLNALPRNEDGDVVGEDGERVDVAYLLKRPLVRVKWMVKFLKVSLRFMLFPLGLC
jgi:hypothetical protein